jgi:KipI family sensor histidine kinase inhibitor
VSPTAIRMAIPTRLRDVRDGVALLDLPEASDEEANRACVALAARLRGRKTPGLRDAVPGARSLLITYDPLRLASATLRDLVGGPLATELHAHDRAHAEARTLIVPVVYDGPDLEELARAAGISSAELARRHGGGEYRVAFLGFAPGFAYMTGLAPKLHAPRLRVPRTRVPAGSVAIGGPYTGVYPESSPGGWRLLGRTSIRLLDPAAEPPALLRAGDRVRFEAFRAEDLPRPTPPRGDAMEPRGAPVLRVLSPGLAATVQGGPRQGLGSSGIPPGGAVDPLSLARANALVGNAPGAAGLEMALVGCELEVLQDAVLAFGGEVEAEWNRRPAAPETALAVAAGDRLRIGRVRRGVWAYLAVRAGLEPLARFAPQPRLAAGDVLTRFEESGSEGESKAPPPHEAAAIDADAESESAREICLRVLPGPESDAFAESELARFLGSAWRVSNECDRRGLRLEGAPPLAHRAAPEIPPSGTVPGTIQVPGGGLPIVLGPDGPVTGGYPRIATVIGADLPLLGRAAPGTLLRWTPVTLEEALRARRSSSPGVS